MKIIAAADFHLGRSASLPDNYGGERNEFSSKYIFEKITDICIKEKADAFLVAGDLLENGSAFFEMKKFLAKECEKLRGAGVKTVFVSGNHDRKTLRQMQLPHMCILGDNYEWEECDLGGLSVWGIGFDPENPSLNPFDRPSLCRIDTDRKYILMLHGDYSAYGGTYAPFAESLACNTVRNSLLTLSGHIHKSAKKDNFINLGSPLAFDFGEDGPHGFWTVNINDGDLTLDGDPVFTQISPIYYDYPKIDVSDYRDDNLVYKIYSDFFTNRKYNAKLAYVRPVIVGEAGEKDFKKVMKECEGLSFSDRIINDIFIDTENIKNKVMRSLDLDALARNTSNIAAQVLAKMLISIREGTFFNNRKYVSLLKKFRDDLCEKCVSGKKESFFDAVPVPSEREILECFEEVIISSLNEIKGDDE